MAQTERVTREVPEEAFRDRIIDLDFHVNPAEEELIAYVEDDRARRKLTTEFGALPRKGKWDAAWAIKEGNEGLFTQGRAQTAADVREAAETFAIDEPIVTPGINNAPTQHHPVLKNELARAYNDLALDQFADEGLYVAPMLPQWDPDAAVAELDRIGDEDRVVAAYGWFGPYTLFGSTEFDPVFEKLVEYDLPLLLHGSLSYWPQHDPVGDNMLTWTEILGLDWPVFGMIHLANMIMTGVFDEYPDLNVVFQEAGHWWLPFLKYRLDEFYEMHPEDVQITPRKYRSGDRYLDHLPSHYMRENVYLCTQPLCPPARARETEMMLEVSDAANTFIYSSDWPHQTLDPPTWYYTNSAFDDETRAAILHGNAEEILGV